jgi:hypothetical protein
MAAQPPPTPKWVLDLNSAPSAKPKASSIPDPPGFTAALSAKQRSQSKNAPQASVRKPPTTEETDTLKLKKAWEIAIAPAKQLPMNAIGTHHPRSPNVQCPIFSFQFPAPFSFVFSLYFHPDREHVTRAHEADRSDSTAQECT